MENNWDLPEEQKAKTLEVLRAHGAKLHSVYTAAKDGLADEVAALIAGGADFNGLFEVRCA